MKARKIGDTVSPAGNRESEKLYVELLKRKPESAYVNLWMGMAQWQKLILGLSKDPENTQAEARQFAEKVLATNNPAASANAHILLGMMDSQKGDHEAALAHVDRALESRLPGQIFHMAGALNVWGGRPDIGVNILKETMRAGPHYPHWVPLELSTGLMLLERYDEAKAINHGILASETDYAGAHAGALGLLAIIAMYEDDPASARQFVDRLLEIEPRYNLRLMRFQIGSRKMGVESAIEALREAGVPENPPGK